MGSLPPAWLPYHVKVAGRMNHASRRSINLISVTTTVQDVASRTKDGERRKKVDARPKVDLDSVLTIPPYLSLYQLGCAGLRGGHHMTFAASRSSHLPLLLYSLPHTQRCAGNLVLFLNSLRPQQALC